MAFDEVLAGRIRARIGERPDLTELRMFGGLAFMLHGNMCFGVVGPSLMVRVGPDAYEEALARAHVREMDFTGRPMRGLVYVESPGFTSDADLSAWLERGLAFATSLPPKD